MSWITTKSSLQNFRQVQQALSLTRSDLAELVKNSFQATFLPLSERQAFLKAVDDFYFSTNKRVEEEYEQLHSNKKEL